MKTKIRLLIETEQLVLVQDMNEDGCASITNNAEAVVEWVLARQADKSPEILYVDTDGRVDELAYKDGKFVGFKFKFNSLPEFQKKRGIPIDGIAVHVVGTIEKAKDSLPEVVFLPYNKMTEEQKDKYARAAMLSPKIALALISALEFPNYSVVVRQDDISLAVPNGEKFPEGVKAHKTDPNLAMFLYMVLGQAWRLHE